MVLYVHCSLILCFYFSTMLLILCALCFSGPLCPLFTDPLYPLTLPFCYTYLLIISYFRTRYMRDYPIAMNIYLQQALWRVVIHRTQVVEEEWKFRVRFSLTKDIRVHQTKISTKTYKDDFSPAVFRSRLGHQYYKLMFRTHRLSHNTWIHCYCCYS